MKIRVVIVDDEALARERIRTLIAPETDIEIVGEYSNGKDAIAAIQKEKPDLLFLDIQMPRISGFDVLRTLDPTAMPVTIFVTAYDQYALQAFEAHAFDYLLKPFREARFRQVLERSRMQLKKECATKLNERLSALLTSTSPSAKTFLKRVAIKTPDKVFFLKCDEIDWIESAGNYLVLHVGKESHILRETLTHLESQLAPEQFVRISRAVIVNVEQIKELQPVTQGDYIVILQSGVSLPMTRGIREIQQHLSFS